jgi:hypothetical protein
MKKKLNTEGIANELAGASLFFYPQNRAAKNPVVDTPLPEKPKEAIPQVRKPAQLSPNPTDFEKVEKYTTHIEPSLIKKIQIEAVEKDINDYDVVRTALNQYFEKNK